MRRAILGTLLGAAMAAVAFGFSEARPTDGAEPPSSEMDRAVAPLAASAGAMIAVTTPGSEDASLLTVIDARREVLSVYAIDRRSGKVKLLSVRNIHWDMEMTEFNSDHPLPREIEGLLQSR